jgi:hypothetical protein
MIENLFRLFEISLAFQRKQFQTLSNKSLLQCRGMVLDLTRLERLLARYRCETGTRDMVWLNLFKLLAGSLRLVPDLAGVDAVPGKDYFHVLKDCRIARRIGNRHVSSKHLVQLSTENSQDLRFQRWV